MGRTVPTFRQWLNAEVQEWIKMKTMLPQEERKAPKELLDMGAISQQEFEEKKKKLLEKI
jgi:hypothetical protein